LLDARIRSDASASKPRPLSRNSESSSPDIAISVMMSQPPTNSPLT